MDIDIPKFNRNDLEGSLEGRGGRIVDTVDPHTFDELQDGADTRRDQIIAAYGQEGTHWFTRDKDPSALTEAEQQEYKLGHKLVDIVVTQAGDERTNRQG